MYEGLVGFDEKNDIEPRLAEKWDISPDGKVYTFHIRQGVKFHNGRPLEAADFKYSWERALNPKTQSPTAATYLEAIVGAIDLANDKRADLPGVEVVDKQTLKVTIDRPRAYFLAQLTYPTAFAFAREVIEKNGGVIDEKAMVGTGPFLFDALRRGQNIAFKANPDYWGGRPKLDGFEGWIYRDPRTAFDNYLTGKLDVSTSRISQYIEDREAGRRQNEYHIFPAATINFLVMNPVAKPVFAKKEVRKAFAMAIDRELIHKLAYKSVQGFDVANGLLPPGMLGAEPSPPPIPYDPAQARQLLAQAGYPGGKGFPTITLITAANGQAIGVACQTIRNNLRDNLGINVVLQEREGAQIIQDETAKTMDFFVGGWIADYPDPQDFLSILFTSNAPLNHSSYSNPQFDALCAQADAEPDRTKRGALYAQANKILMEDVGVLPLMLSPRLLIISPKIQNYRMNICTILPFTQLTKTGACAVLPLKGHEKRYGFLGAI